MCEYPTHGAIEVKQKRALGGEDGVGSGSHALGRVLVADHVPHAVKLLLGLLGKEGADTFVAVPSCEVK